MMKESFMKYLCKYPKTESFNGRERLYRNAFSTVNSLYIFDKEEDSQDFEEDGIVLFEDDYKELEDFKEDGIVLFKDGCKDLEDFKEDGTVQFKDTQGGYKDLEDFKENGIVLFEDTEEDHKEIEDFKEDGNGIVLFEDTKKDYRDLQGFKEDGNDIVLFEDTEEDCNEEIIKSCSSSRFFFIPQETKSILHNGKGILSLERRDDGFDDNFRSEKDGHEDSYEGMCVAVSKNSPNPYMDFRDSMQEIVDANGGADCCDWEFMKEMVICYLHLNPISTHPFIFHAFADLLALILSDSDNKEEEHLDL